MDKNNNYLDFLKNMESNHLMPNADLSKFMELKKYFLNDVKKVMGNESPVAGEIIEKVLSYNLTGGRKTRPALLFQSYKILEKPENITHDKMLSVYLLGWCAELEIAALNILDDITDDSDYRRGLPCWYRNPDVGLGAVNQGIFLMLLVNKMMKYYYDGTPYCTNLLSIIDNMTYGYFIGQMLDQNMKIVNENSWKNMSMRTFKSIIKKKSTSATNCIVYCAMVLADKYTEINKAEIEDILDEIGFFAQVNNDYIDCFVEPCISGVTSSDIKQGAVTWFLVMALEKSTEEQKSTLMLNYGKNDDASMMKVKILYKDLNLNEEYLIFKDSSYRKVLSMLNNVSDCSLKSMLKIFAKKIIDQLID